MERAARNAGIAPGKLERAERQRPALNLQARPQPELRCVDFERVKAVVARSEANHAVVGAAAWIRQKLDAGNLHGLAVLRLGFERTARELHQVAVDSNDARIEFGRIFGIIQIIGFSKAASRIENHRRRMESLVICNDSALVERDGSRNVYLAVIIEFSVPDDQLCSLKFGVWPIISGIPFSIFE